MVSVIAKIRHRRKAPLVYSIESFRLRAHKVEHFDMMLIEKDGVEMGSLEPHRHNCYLILVVTNGTGTHCVDGENFSVGPNTIFLLSPGQIHNFVFTPETRGFAVYFTNEFYLHYARERHLDKMPFFRSLQPQLYVKTTEEKMKSLTVVLNEMLLEYCRDWKAKEDVLRNLLDVFLIRLHRLWNHDYRIKGKVTSAVQVRKLMQFIEVHYRHGLTAGDYAGLMNITLNHLNTLCKQSISFTVTDLVQNRILVEAKRLLAYTDYPVKKIATEMGFKDSSYFLRVFKKKTGMTPDQFRADYIIAH